MVKSFLPMLQEQFLQIKFPPTADVADLGSDVIEYSTGEVAFRELTVPEDKVPPLLHQICVIDFKILRLKSL
jgi:hypothetical protein